MQLLDNNWVISPAGGMTGEAYMAQSSKEKIFLKRNSSPFLAVLSAEGIVPRLLWTKRLENGDVITAQRWSKGRVLKANEMASKEVAQLLNKIHTSKPLFHMLARLGKTPITAQFILNECLEKVTPLFLNQQLEDAIHFLKRTVHAVHCDERVVCHSDINHNNWLMEQSGRLFLVDWDQAIIADPAIDLGMLLYWYIDPSDWQLWLENYGIPLDEPLRLRMHWYMVAQTIQLMIWHKERHHDKEAQIYENDLVRLSQLTPNNYFPK